MSDPWAGQGGRDIVRAAAQPDGAAIMSAPRAGDAQRDRYLNHVTDCHARGYLDDEIFERRRDLILAAQQLPQLQVLIEDLPPLPLERKAVTAERKKQWAFYLSRKPWRGLAHGAVAIPLLLLAILPAVFLAQGPHWGQSPLRLSAVIVTIAVGAIASLANFAWLMTWTLE